MSKTIYLYLKTHNITGFKYLGKTTKDPFKYKGSGKLWLRHLHKNGYDVTTEILFETMCEKEFYKVGLKYSKNWDIVNSKEFANLMFETGTGGDNPESRKPEVISKAQETKRINGKRWKLKKEVKDVHGKIIKKWWNSEEGKKRKKELYMGSKKELLDSFIGPPNPPGWWKNNKMKYKCPHCSKEGDLRNMKRWHFDNCKKAMWD